MIKDNQQYFNKLHVLIDALVIIVSYVFAWWLKFLSGILDHEVGVLSFEFYMRALLLIVPVYILLYYAFNLYTSKRVQGRRLEFSNIVMANTVGLLLMFAALFTLTSYNPQYRNFSREMLFYFYVTNIVVEEIVRLLIRRFLRSIRRRGYNLKHILLVGYSRAAEQYIDRIQQNPQWGYNVRGVLDDNIARGTSYKGVKVIGSIGNLNYILPQNSLDEIAITLGLEEYYKLEKIEVRRAHQVHSGLRQHHTYETLHGGSSGSPCDQYPLCAAVQHVQRICEALYGCGGIDCVYHPLFTGDAAVGNPCQGDIEGTADLCTGESGAAQ